MEDRPINILLIEDNPGDVRLIQELLNEVREVQYDLGCTDRLSKGLEQLVTETIDIVLLDLGLSDSQGLDTFIKLHAQAPRTPIIVMTGLDDKALAVKAVREGAQDFLVKGQVDGNLLMRAIRYAIERKRTEIQIKESEEKYSNLVEKGNDGIIIIQDGLLKFANSKMVEITGFSLEEALGKSFIDFISPEYRKVVSDRYKKRISGEEVPNRYEIALLSRDGRKIPAEVSASRIDYKGKPANMAIIRDITKRKQAEKALAAEKERLAITLRSIGDGVIATDTEGKIVLMNKIAEILTDWTQEEAIGKPLTNVFHIINEKTRKRSENPVEKALKTGEIIALANHTVLIARDGTERIIADSGAPIRDRDGNIIGVVLVFRDITEKLRMEEELLKVEKLESIGLLAGGIAHDFNNILTGILGNVNLAKLSALVYLSDKPRKRLFDLLTEAEKVTMRAKNLTRQLLTFSKGSRPITKTASISELLKDTVSFALSGSNIQFKFFVPKDLWLVDIDEGQISQVINNLVINADQAMPEGGQIEVRARNIIIGVEDALPLHEGNYVKLSIKDQGIGIPKEHLPHIFDPYFTTKEGGSGLGLTIAYSVIKKHGGYIDVDSVPNVGTTFSIYLPASQKPILKKKKVEKRLIIGKGRILVMDDEDVIREALSEILVYLGYQAEVTRNGEEAIAIYKKAKDLGQPFDIVILDLTIRGGMGGKETIKKLLELDPRVNAIVSSGYFYDPVMADFRKYGFSGVVAKPYTINELSETLSKVIRRPDERVIV
ncbi:MAG: PAS domain S-box protein [Promethearchaeota archaeon]